MSSVNERWQTSSLWERNVYLNHKHIYVINKQSFIENSQVGSGSTFAAAMSDPAAGGGAPAHLAHFRRVTRIKKLCSIVT